MTSHSAHHRPSTGFELRHGLLVAVLLPICLFANLVLCAGYGDFLHSYPTRAFYDETHVIELNRTTGLQEQETGDFDGDGIDDKLEHEYHHVEPLFEPRSSFIVQVRSGRDGRILLAHLTNGWLSPFKWYGDLDGNGTDDVIYGGINAGTAFGSTSVR